MALRELYVYIMTNERHTVLYVGVTGDLVQRVRDHREKRVPGFTSRYNLTKLVYWEAIAGPNTAIAREKQLKAGSRQKKLDLLAEMNPEWKDLWESIQEE